jgi:uncharacterized membrane protein YfcA
VLSAGLLGGLGLFAVGVALGFLGAGGTAIALPVLVYWLGMQPHLAVTVSLLLVGGVSVFGAVLHARRGLVRWKAALAFAPFGAAGAALGSRWSYLLSGRALLLSFSCLLAVLAIRMLWEKCGDPEKENHRWHWIALSGFGIGIITGLLGVGGGFVIVPAMVYCAGLGMKPAVASSLVVIGVNSLTAFASHIQRQQVQWGSVTVLMLCAGAGMALGVELSHRTHPGHLRKAFAILLLCLSGFMLYRNL